MRSIDTGDVRLALREQGDPANPTVLLVHGYPDTHRVWDEVAGLLEPEFHVVRYDVRGAGESSAPAGIGGYRLDRLVDDLAAVLDAVGKSAVHLVGHDWGSVQGWAAAARLPGRLLSFTSLSGPGLAQWSEFLRTGGRREVAGQALRSWYITAFRMPVVPELAWRTFLPRLVALTRVAEGIEPREGDPAATLPADGARGLALYRANTSARAAGPGQVDVPVQVIEARRDRFISRPLVQALDRAAPQVWRRTIPAGHWAQRSHPATVARMIAEFARYTGAGAAPSRELRRSRAGEAGGPFDRRLVVVTGAGDGIGRATARAFAAHGAEVVCADIDLAAARDTVAGITARGGTGHAERVDVSSAEEMERFAREVLDRYGTPDIVVNNAGLAVAGAFLDHEVADWRRLIDVNLWGVVHGCRLFARQMADRGEGGHIVNVASVAAFMPTRVLPAYSTTKAAVKMLSDCLRAELAGQDIGVTAICPGFVSTGVARNATYRGVDRGLSERAVAARGYPPERVAAHILRAVHRNLAVVPVNAEGRFGYALSRISPGLTRRLARLGRPELLRRAGRPDRTDMGRPAAKD
ncbi:SDR family oxidoreductase [Sphaerisporangium rufum]|nr:SDR family oxidoreductase [Sphaerisporangium rufum]